MQNESNAGAKRCPAEVPGDPMMIPIEAAALVSVIAYVLGVMVGMYKTYISETQVMDKGK